MRVIDARPHGLILRGLAAVLMLAVPAAARAGTCEATADYGAVLSQSDIDNAVKALPPQALKGKRGKPVKTPAKRVMLDNLPAVAQQGTLADPGYPGTCEAQSFAYGLGSYTAARDSDGNIRWQASQPQNAVSAAYLYALVQQQSGRQCPQGSRSLDYLAQLTRAGAPSRAQVPYQSSCTYLDNISTGPLPSMSRFQIGSYAVIPISNNDNAVPQIKAHLQAGQAVAFTGRVLCGYAQNPTFKSGVIYDTAIVPNSGHGQLVVGYDDKIGREGERGAFLVQNSFGTSWPPAGSGSAAPAGQAYWSYGSFSATQAMAAVAYPVTGELGDNRLQTATFDAPVASVVRAYQWTPGGEDTSVYLILRLAFQSPVTLNQLWLTEPGGSELEVKAVYGQPISAGYAYLKRSDGKSFLSGSYKLTLKAGDGGNASVTYTGKVKIKKLKKAGDLAPASMQGVTILGPTGSPVTTN